MKVLINGIKFDINPSEYRKLKDQNPESVKILSCDGTETLDDKYKNQIRKCSELISYIENIMILVPSPNQASWADYGSAYQVWEHLDRVYDSLVSWTGFDVKPD
jgi:hypothetical protein